MTTGSTIISTVLVLHVLVVLKMKLRLIFYYAALATTPHVKLTSDPSILNIWKLFLEPFNPTMSPSARPLSLNPVDFH